MSIVSSLSVKKVELIYTNIDSFLVIRVLRHFYQVKNLLLLRAIIMNLLLAVETGISLPKHHI